MGEIIYSTAKRFPGPWLLDRERLELLDKLIDQERQRLARYREERLIKKVEDRFRQRVESAVKYPYSQEEKEKILSEIKQEEESDYYNRIKFSLELTFEDRRKFVPNSFLEAIRDPALTNEKIVGFSLELGLLDVEATIEISSLDSSMVIRVSPEAHPIGREIFVSFQDWALSSQPPLWLRIWKAFNGMQWAILLIFAVMTGPFLLKQKPSAALSQQYQMAEDLLKQGVSTNDVPKALELILGRTFNSPTAKWYYVLDRKFLFFDFSLLVACILTSKVPKNCLGIGKGTNSVARWRKWAQFVAIALPLWIFSTFIAPPLIEWVKSIFHG